jgi:hypothetical protein
MVSRQQKGIRGGSPLKGGEVKYIPCLLEQTGEQRPVLYGGRWKRIALEQTRRAKQ